MDSRRVRQADSNLRWVLQLRAWLPNPPFITQRLPTGVNSEGRRADPGSSRGISDAKSLFDTRNPASFGDKRVIQE